MRQTDVVSLFAPRPVGDPRVGGCLRAGLRGQLNSNQRCGKCDLEMHSDVSVSGEQSNARRQQPVSTGDDDDRVHCDGGREDDSKSS